MDKLIPKAIQAIKDGKTEYAIGLLEGVLEMTGNGDVALLRTKEPVVNIQPGALSVHKVDTVSDNSDVLDAYAKANINKVKQMGSLSTE